MELHFEATQDHQLQAIEAVADLLRGQPYRETEVTFELGLGAATVSNGDDFDGDALLHNLQTVQLRNGIRPDRALAVISDDALFPNFSVEMETGTGKTYVYLRTALELASRYGLKKFIIVVPSVAIREGVLATLKATKQHFSALYHRLPYQFARYDSANLHQVREFALSQSIQIMVMTLDAFNKAANVIGRSNDQLQGETPLHLIQATRPILILDEPQNMESQQSKAALASLHPLLCLRYSATHRQPYNIVYRLSPYEAYRRSLVKRIEVAGIEQEGEVSAFLRLDEIDSQGSKVKARVTVQVPNASGSLKLKTVLIKPGDDLYQKTRRLDYKGFVVREIERFAGEVIFDNDHTIKLGEARGPDQHALWKAQIRYTVEEHFRKQRNLKEQGVKVLSLFFIDRVDNYAAEGGIIRQLFDEAFLDLRQKYPDWEEIEPEKVQAAYFAQKKSKGGESRAVDSTGDNAQDETAFNLIMKEKERLLSFDVPVSFIFSHSALREGWDNPNIFQICTLNQAVSERRRRQEIGRGVRLAVNQSGQRVMEEQINVLTVIANEAYGRYVSGLQSELAVEYQAEIEARFGKLIAALTDDERAAIAAEYGQELLPPRPEDARKRAQATIRKGFLLSPEFQTLWDKIKRRTRYNVQLDTERLLADVLPEINALHIQAPQIKVTKAAVMAEGSSFTAQQMTMTRTVASLQSEFQPINLIELMESMLAQANPPLRLTRKTLFEVYQRSTIKDTIHQNPQEFAALSTGILRRKLIEQIVHGLEYQPDGTWYELHQFREWQPSWSEHLVPAQHSLYDHVIVDSGVERRFVEGLEARNDVKLYVKLPKWFTVPTPLGTYNPDWAIVMQPRDEFGEPTGDELLYLVRETKDTTVLAELDEEERQKVICGTKHFQKIGVDYRVVTSASELP